MDLDTPEGKLSITDAELKFVPADDGPEIRVLLSPTVPDYEYQRGIQGLGALVIDGHVIVLRNEQASAVVEELRRSRPTPGKRGSDTAAPGK